MTSKRGTRVTRRRPLAEGAHGKGRGSILLVGALSAVLWRSVESRKTPAIQYKTAPVARREMVGRTTATGTLSALVTVHIGTQVSGRIEKLNADFNSSVKKGQVVAKLDPQLFQAAVEQAQANYLAAKAALSSAPAQRGNAEKQAARARSLHDQGLASQADLDNAEAGAATARAAVEGAKASVAQATRAAPPGADQPLVHAASSSPIDGVVISRSVDVGQTVAASLSAPTLFTIAQDLTKMQVDTNVAEGDVGRLQHRDEDVLHGRLVPRAVASRGVVRQIRNAATTVQNVVTYDAVIDVDNADLSLRPGMTANVTFVYAQEPDALAVPAAAFRFARRNGRPCVPTAPGMRTLWVLGGGALRPVGVRTGLADGPFTEVLGHDLKEGDEVVVQAMGGEGPSPTAPKAPLVPGRPPPMF